MSTSNNSASPLRRLILAVGVSAIFLPTGACSSSVIDSIPSWAGGEPAGTPERPAAVADYPAVHDRPSPRATELITEQEQAKIEQELAAARAAQTQRAQEVQKNRDDMLANFPSSSASNDGSSAQQKTKPRNPPAN